MVQHFIDQTWQREHSEGGTCTIRPGRCWGGGAGSLEPKLGTLASLPDALLEPNVMPAPGPS